MADEDKSLKDIKSGKGLEPIPVQGTSTQSGVIAEQRGQKAGFRKDIFTLQAPTQNNRGK
jgi:hypothetical protein